MNALKTLSFILVVLLFSCSKDATKDIFKPDFTFAPHPTDGNVYVFTNTTQGEHTHWRWVFGNGERTDRELVNESEISAFYPESGTYEITLTIWGSSDLADNKSITKEITVENNVFTPSVSIEPVNGKVNTYNISNATTGDFDECTWTIKGELRNDNGQAVEVYYPFKGSYNIELNVTKGDYTVNTNKEIIIYNEDPDFFDHYQLVWNDEFNGTELDADKWTFETGANGWGNNEWQNYTNNENISLNNGKLSITAKLEGDGQKVGDYTSARLNAKQSFTYGIFEVRAKMPSDNGPGIWPAIWMLGESIQNGRSWPLCGEIDMMEYVSWDPNKVSCAIHTESNNHTLGNNIGSGHVDLETAEEEFHNYGLIWTESFLRFYRDDINNTILIYNKPVNSNKENWPFDEPFYYLLNIAVGGSYGGAQGVDDNIFPSTMEVEYVKVFQLD